MQKYMETYMEKDGKKVNFQHHEMDRSVKATEQQQRLPQVDGVEVLQDVPHLSGLSNPIKYFTSFSVYQKFSL